MKEISNEAPLKKERKRIPYKKGRPGDDEPSFLSSSERMRLHDLKQKSATLEERIGKLTTRMESYHLAMQRSHSQKLKVEKKIRGVLKHIKATMEADAIPGAALKDDPVEQENRLLQWKLNIIEKYLYGIFPEFVGKRVQVTIAED